MPDLILRPSNNPEKPWALQLRWHESLGETEYYTIARVSDALAREIVAAGAAFWLFGDPDKQPTTSAYETTRLAEALAEARAALRRCGCVSCIKTLAVLDAEAERNNV